MYLSHIRIMDMVHMELSQIFRHFRDKGIYIQTIFRKFTFFFNYEIIRELSSLFGRGECPRGVMVN